MMLAMALAHRQRAARAGGGWCREGSAQPPGLCTLLAAIALFLALVGSATLGVEPVSYTHLTLPTIRLV